MELILDIITISASAFTGAWAAFLSERWRKNHEDKKERHMKLRQAHFVLIQQLVDLRNIRSQFLDRFKSHPDRWRTLPPTKLKALPLTLDIKELFFLLKSDSPDLLNRLYVGDSRFATLQEALNVRAGLHIRLQERMATLQQQGFFDKAGLSETEIDFALGKDLVEQLKDITNFVFEDDEGTEEFLKQNLDSIGEFLKRNFPKERPPAYELLSPKSHD